MITLKGIEAEFDIVDCQKVVHTETVYDDTEEKHFDYKVIEKRILLGSDTEGVNNILVIKYYDEDEYSVQGAYEIVDDILGRMNKWNLVIDNISKGFLVISAVEGTASDMNVLMRVNFDTMQEYDDFMECVEINSNESYKFNKVERGTMSKLIEG